VSKIWNYTKKYNLQNPANKREILADARLKPVFDGKDKVSMFEINKHLAKHLKSYDADCEGPTPSPLAMDERPLPGGRPRSGNGASRSLQIAGRRPTNNSLVRGVNADCTSRASAGRSAADPLPDARRRSRRPDGAAGNGRGAGRPSTFAARQSNCATDAVRFLGVNTGAQRRRRARPHPCAGQGDTDGGISTLGQAQGLIHDFPTVGEMVRNVTRQAEEMLGPRPGRWGAEPRSESGLAPVELQRAFPEREPVEARRHGTLQTLQLFWRAGVDPDVEPRSGGLEGHERIGRVVRAARVLRGKSPCLAPGRTRR